MTKPIKRIRTRGKNIKRDQNYFEKSSVRVRFHIVGLIVIVIAFVLISAGQIDRNEADEMDTTSTEPSIWGDRENTDLDKVQEKNDKEMEGFTKISFGIFILFIGIVINIFPYMPRFTAHYYQPVFREMGDSIGEGMSKAEIDIEVEEGYKNDEVKEVIKVKCRKCGYLETEDAKYCSKCGSDI